MTPDPSSDPALARRRLAAVASVASLVVHSGRNRLAVARAGLELLKERMEGNLNDEARACFLRELDLFLAEFNLGADLLRCHDGPIEAVSALEAAYGAVEAVRPRAEAAGIALELEAAENLPPVRADRGLLRVVLLNLLRNAVEAIEESPGRARREGRIRLRLEAAGPRCRIEVEDDGPGVPPDLRRSLFRDYVTGRRGAAGLGLCLCRDAAALMGGTIAHLERAGPGAAFRLELDFQAEPVPAA